MRGKTRISTLARSTVRKANQSPLPSEPRTQPSQDSATVTPAESCQNQSDPKGGSKPSPQVHPRVEDPLRKYTIVPTQNPSLHPVESREWERRKRGRPTAPYVLHWPLAYHFEPSTDVYWPTSPKVHSYKELQNATFVMYDAVPSSSSLVSLASPGRLAGPGDNDPEVAKFLPLLQDYLKSLCHLTFTHYGVNSP